MEGRADVPPPGPLGSQLLVSHDVGPCSNQQQQQLVLTWGPGPGEAGRQAGRAGKVTPVPASGVTRRETSSVSLSSHDEIPAPALLHMWFIIR